MVKKSFSIYRKPARQEEFLRLFDEKTEEARKLVYARNHRNDVVAIPDMYPYPVETIVGIIYDKLGRIMGEWEADNLKGVLAELPDIANYANFLSALIEFHCLEVVKEEEVPEPLVSTHRQKLIDLLTESAPDWTETLQERFTKGV